MKRRKCKAQGKQVYPTKLAAIRAALSYSKKRGTPLRPYYHRDCKGWHLSSKPRRDVDINTKESVA